MTVGGDDEAAGMTPAAGERAARVQPSGHSGFDLGKPIPPDAILANIKPMLADEARQKQENLRRRMVDQELLTNLAASGFTGPRYERFEEVLAAYGMSVLRGWMHSGYIFKLVADRGFSLHPSDSELEELFRDSDAREELANMTVALALPRFREHALVRGGWKVEGGASLPTYFMGTCLYVFPNEFRKRRVYQQKYTRAQRGEAVTLEPMSNPATNPAETTTGNIRVCDDLQRADPRERAIVALTIDGYSQEEIVELLNEVSVRAVQGVLYRWRTKERLAVHEGGEPDARA